MNLVKRLEEITKLNDLLYKEYDETDFPLYHASTSEEDIKKAIKMFYGEVSEYAYIDVIKDYMNKSEDLLHKVGDISSDIDNLLND